MINDEYSEIFLTYFLTYRPPQYFAQNTEGVSL
jgi:hypothetical protein